MTERQPLLHDLVITVAAPTAVLSGMDGQLRGTGAQGVLHGDHRVLSAAVLTVDGREPEPISGGPDGFVGLLGHLDPPGSHDPVARLHRRREVSGSGVVERLELTGLDERDCVVRLALRADFAAISAVKSGVDTAAVAPRVDGESVVWDADGLHSTLTAPGARITVDGADAVLTWLVRGSSSLEWTLSVDDPGAVFAAAESLLVMPSIEADDPRLSDMVSRSVADLNRLLLTDGTDRFAAAGAPWYLTLFGRDSLWAARLALPSSVDLAGETLRTLARLQGTRHDPATGEAPGKIPHERRRAGFRLGDMMLPALYYGTVDATALWVCLLHDAWRAGLPDEQVRPLLPALRAALDWITGPADPDGDGFAEYVDEMGTGLANQGWKDSADAVRFADGRFANPPIALAEVQAYHHEALHSGADVLAAFGESGAGLREHAAELATRFRAAFWVSGYPALALDRDKRPVDAPASNMGHLLGTGLLDGAESALVARRLAEPDLTGPFGVRTLSSAAAAYSPLSYHCGSVWPHDTAIIARGLAAAGFRDQAADLAARLLRAAGSLDWELPELYAGFGKSARPVPYPASCRPQAWSAAAGIAALWVLLGLAVDVPGRTVTVRPPTSGPVGALAVSGIPLAGGTLDIRVDRDGTVLDVLAPAGFTVNS
ncbi:glycogen debranching N-terminal domain-containing protein [Actinokineospora sp.]|uniref:glycogen debranching N-terminal domain-containing protein n=1 Tax=Actinokineospora sp. TaxID=1872133 RepID=UPI0040383B89